MTESLLLNCLQERMLFQYRDTVYTGNSNTKRARNTEIKIMPAIDVKAWQKETDLISKEIRLIDNKIQETNWTTELIE